MGPITMSSHDQSRKNAARVSYNTKPLCCIIDCTDAFASVFLGINELQCQDDIRPVIKLKRSDLTVAELEMFDAFIGVVHDRLNREAIKNSARVGR